MDYIHACYVTRMKLVAGDPTEYLVRWVWAAPGAPVLEGHSPFRSNRTWDNAYKPPLHYRRTTWADKFYKTLFKPPALGEQLWASDCVYDRGISKDRLCAHPVCIDPQVFVTGPPPAPLPVPDPCCPPPVEKVVMSWEVRGAGAVVCLGSPTLFAPPHTVPVTPAANAPNAAWWAQFDYWVQRRGNGALNSAAAGDARAWQMASVWAPLYADVAAAATDYTSEVAREELEDTLSRTRILWCGFADLTTDPPQQLNADVYDLLITWIRDGGILVVVGASDDIDANPPAMNANLLGLNCEQQFNRDFIGGQTRPTQQSAVASFSSAGNDTNPFFAARWAPTPINPGHPFVTESISAIGAGIGYKELLIGLQPPPWSPTLATTCSVTLTISRQGSNPFSSIEGIIYTPGARDPVGVIPGNASALPTAYTFPAPPTPSWPININGVTPQIGLQPFGSGVNQGLTLSAFSVTYFAAGPRVPVLIGVRENECAPMVRPVPGRAAQCNPQFWKACTITGGLTVLWWDETTYFHCVHGTLSLVGSGHQRGPSHQTPQGKLAMLGRTVQLHIPRYHATGLLELVGDTRQITPARQRPAGLLGLVGATVQLHGSVQRPAGLLGLLGETVQLLGVVQRPAGLLGLLGVTTQPALQAQRVTGLLGLSGSTTQTTPPIVYLLDHFTDANGVNLTAHTMDVGSGWTASTGTITIQGNAAAPSVSPSRYYAFSGSGNQIATVTFTFNASGQTTVLAFRFPSSLTGFGIACVGGSPVKLCSILAGAIGSQLGSLGPTIPTTGTFTVSLKGVGSVITAYLNGVAFTSITNGLNATQLRVGIFGLGGTAWTADDFQVTSP